MKIVAIVVLLVTVVLTVYGGFATVRNFRASLATRVVRARVD